MTTFTKTAKSSTTMTKVAKLKRGKAGRFGEGIFGSARFGITDDLTKVAKPSTSHTKEARP